MIDTTVSIFNYHFCLFSDYDQYSSRWMAESCISLVLGISVARFPVLSSPIVFSLFRASSPAAQFAIFPTIIEVDSPPISLAHFLVHIFAAIIITSSLLSFS